MGKEFYEVQSHGVTLEITPVLKDAQEVYSKSSSSRKVLFHHLGNGTKVAIASFYGI